MTLVANEPGDGLPLDRATIDDRESHVLPTVSHIVCSIQGNIPYTIPRNSPLELHSRHCFSSIFLFYVSGC